MTQDDLLRKIDERLERMETEQKRQGEDIKSLKDGQNRLDNTVGHLQTAVEALKEGQDDIRRDMATKDDIHWLASKIDKHERRIENLEENTGTPNPFKH